MLAIYIVEAAVAQPERRGDIAVVQDLLHVFAHEVPVDIVLVAVVGIVVVAEALLQSMVDLGTGYRLLYLICWVFCRCHSPLAQALRS